MQLAQAQALLNILGYDTGTVDGVYGSRTDRAVRAFERDAGWPETGNVTRRLIRELRTLAARAIETASAAGAVPGSVGILRQSNGEPYSRPGDAAVAYRVERSDPLPAAASIASVETALPEPGTCLLDQPGALEDVNLFSTWRAVLSAAVDACGSGGKLKGRRELQSFLAPLTPALLARAEAAYDERYLVWMQDDADPSYTRCGETVAYQDAIEGLRERTDRYKRRVEEHMRHLCRPEEPAAPGPGEARKDYPDESWLDPIRRESAVERGRQLAKADAVVTYCTGQRNPDVRREYLTIMKINFPELEDRVVAGLYDDDFDAETGVWTEKLVECDAGDLLAAGRVIETGLAAMQPGARSNELTLGRAGNAIP